MTKDELEHAAVADATRVGGSDADGAINLDTITREEARALQSTEQKM
jgi:hypothetical protein